MCATKPSDLILNRSLPIEMISQVFDLCKSNWNDLRRADKHTRVAKSFSLDVMCRE